MICPTQVVFCIDFIELDRMPNWAFAGLGILTLEQCISPKEAVVVLRSLQGAASCPRITHMRNDSE